MILVNTFKLKQHFIQHNNTKRCDTKSKNRRILSEK